MLIPYLCTSYLSIFFFTNGFQNLKFTFQAITIHAPSFYHFASSQTLPSFESQLILLRVKSGLARLKSGSVETLQFSGTQSFSGLPIPLPFPYPDLHQPQPLPIHHVQCQTPSAWTWYVLDCVHACARAHFRYATVAFQNFSTASLFQT
jgi:hypothetical protein